VRGISHSSGATVTQQAAAFFFDYEQSTRGVKRRQKNKSEEKNKSQEKNKSGRAVYPRLFPTQNIGEIGWEQAGVNRPS